MKAARSINDWQVSSLFGSKSLKISCSRFFSRSTLVFLVSFAISTPPCVARGVEFNSPARSPTLVFSRRDGGSPTARSVICVADDLSIWAVQAPAWRCLPRVALFVVAGLALVPKAPWVQADIRIVAVDIIQPDSVMYDQPRLIVAHLAHTAIEREPVIDVCLPRSFPRLRLVKLFLCHSIQPIRKGPGASPILPVNIYALVRFRVWTQRQARSAWPRPRCRTAF